MIKILMTKTGDQIICGIETFLDEKDNPIGYLLTNPYIVKLLPTMDLDEEGQPKGFTINYTKWMACSEDIEYRVAFDYIVAVANPEKQLYDTYVQKFGGEQNGTADGTNDGDAIVNDTSDSSEGSGLSDSAD